MQVAWNQDHSLKQEVTFDGNTDITLSFIEPLTLKAEQALPLRLSARAQFSHYSITPARGLHFGPVTYNTTSKPRTFEISNLGEFPFTMKLLPLGEPPQPPPTSATAATGKGGKGPGAKGGAAAAGATAAAGRKSVVAKAADVVPAGPNSLQLGQFVFEPAEAVIQPGGQQVVSVVFKAEGAATYTATAGISISERDFGDHPEGLPCEVAGESCIPGAAARAGFGRGEPR